MAKKFLTFDELQELALANYTNGGDAVVECWDEATYKEYCEEFGPLTEKAALEMFALNKSIWDEMQATIW